MALDDLLISTGVDNLIKLVHERGKIELGAAAEEMKLPRATVEDWAHVLEGEGIIKIDYRLTKLFLVWASMQPEEFAKATKTVAAKKSDTEEKIENLIATVEKSAVELDGLKSEMRLAKQKSEVTIETLESGGREILSMAQDIDKLIAEKEKRLGLFRKELNSLHSEMEMLSDSQKKMASPKKGKFDEAAQVETLKRAEDKLDRQIREFQDSYDDLESKVAVAQELISKDRTMDELAHIKSSVADLQFAKAEILKSVEGMRDEAKQIGREIDTLTQRISEIELKKVSTANPKKLLAQLDEAAYAARNERDTTLAELQKSLEMVRKQLQAYSQLQYQYQTLNARVSSLQSSYTRETEEVEQFVGALEGAYKKYSRDLSGLSAAIDEQKKRYGEMQVKAKHLEMILSQVEALRQEGDSLAIKLKGVLKEAQVIGMKAPGYGGTGAGGAAYGGGSGGSGGAGGAGGSGGAGGMRRTKGAGSVRSSEPTLPPELVQRINLSQQEEEEFERKREELRGLIRRMWEEDRSKGDGAA